MNHEILTSDERKSIRAEIYREKLNQSVDYSDKKISFFIKHLQGKSVLDLGSVDHYEENYKSKYWLFKAIQEHASEVYGLDYYKEGVDILYSAGFNIHFGDAQNFNMDRQFEVITAGDLIEHLPNLDGFITSVKRTLSKNGQLLISTPNPWCWKYFLYHLFYGKLEPVNREHVAWFCLKTLENLFARYGFEIVEFTYSSRRKFEKIIPLPPRLKHTTLNILLKISN